MKGLDFSFGTGSIASVNPHDDDFIFPDLRVFPGDASGYLEHTSVSS